MNKSSYQLTLIDNHTLLKRLAKEVAFMRDQTFHFWSDFRHDPFTVGRRTLVAAQLRGRLFLTAPNRITATLSALIVMSAIVGFALLMDRGVTGVSAHADVEQLDVELLTVGPVKPAEKQAENSFGENGTGRVGLRAGRGEGSGSKLQPSRGGGSGGDRSPLPAQSGEIPPPSNIAAAIPATPPLHPPVLPIAGIDIDPALWQDLKKPVYGDPSSSSQVTSKGPGEGGGIGTNKGLGTGSGDGNGHGPGSKGNTGGEENATGCCGPGGGTNYNNGVEDRTFRNQEVEQKVRIISKPEPQYTEEARRTGLSGTVILRVVFSSLGEVVQVRAITSLPYGLTERAITAARQIKFMPAMKGGRPVSVYMQLEYNFNLY